MDSQEVKILLVEDNPIDADVLREQLSDVESPTYVVSNVQRLSDAVERLAEERFDLILLDLGLPDSQGIDTFLQTQRAAQGVPIVVMSGLDDEVLAVEAVRTGAQDYLVKGFGDTGLLIRSLNYAVQRQQLITELELGKERLSAQYKWIPVPTYTWEHVDDDFLLIDCNNAAEREAGSRLPLGTKAGDVFRAEPEILSDFARCFSEKTTFMREKLLQFSFVTGSRYLEITYVFVPPNLVMIHVEDETDRKLAEQALRESEERFRAIFESAQDAIFIKDQNLKYSHVNPAFGKLYGLEPSAVIGRRAEELFGKQAGKHITDIDLRVLAGETVEEEHAALINGVERTFHHVSVPLLDVSGTIIGMCGVSRDVTERRRVLPIPRVAADKYNSDAMRAAVLEARKAAATDSIVLLLGESGSGKDYLARWIHEHSKRAGGPYFSVNCAAVAKELAESELFGHESGAFTGARGRKRGLLELAEGGTLLLNEIGELPLPLQSKLLTFLDTRSFLRVGGEKNVHVNARLIAATHRDLEQEVAEGRFLSPLFYRLNVFTISVPPLRERVQDIPLLVDEIMSKLAEEMQLTHVPTIDLGSMRSLTQYTWPGNVRELRNVVERALMLSDGEYLTISLPAAGANSSDWSYHLRFQSNRTLHDMTDEVIQWLCVEGLRRTGGSKKKAASLLGISRDSLYRYMKRFGIEREGEDDMDN
ncbi:MAG: sigma 54-interacting transcriptional regulator [Desulfomonile tiedjei]|nr:sigma 54-interacting transcriptional regulator [Desulfomonile tiedjei]